MSDCSGIGRRQATAGGNLPSQEIREANKANRVVYDPNDRNFVAPKKAAPKPSGNVCYTVASLTEIAAVRNGGRNIEGAAFGTPKEQEERMLAAKKRKKQEDRAMRAAGIAVQASGDGRGLPKDFKDSVIVQAGNPGPATPVAIGKVKAPPKQLGFQELLHGHELSRVYILPDYETKKGEIKQVEIMTEIRNLSTARGDSLISVKCNLGAFLVTQTPYKEGEQNFIRIEIRHFVNVGSAHKAGEKAMYEPREKELPMNADRPKEPAQCAIKYNVSDTLYRHEILASEAGTMRDALVRDTTARIKPPNYNRSTDWRKQPGGARAAMAANAAYYIAKGG